MNIEKLVIYALKDTDCPLYDKTLNPAGIIPIIAALNQPEPRAPYLLINVINTRNVGLPYKSTNHKSIDVREHVFQVKEYLISLTLHAKTGDTAQEWFRHFENGIHSDMVDWAFTKQGLGLVNSGGIMYQPQPVDGKNYKRANIDITFRAEILDEFFVNDIKQVTVEGILNTEIQDNIADIIIIKNADNWEIGG